MLSIKLSVVSTTALIKNMELASVLYLRVIVLSVCLAVVFVQYILLLYKFSFVSLVLFLHFLVCIRRNQASVKMPVVFVLWSCSGSTWYAVISCAPQRSANTPVQAGTSSSFVSCVLSRPFCFVRYIHA